MDEEPCVMVNGRKTVVRKMWLGNKIQYGVTLQMHYSFGLKQNVASYLFKEESLIYVSGYHLVIHDIAKKKQSFMLRQKDEEDVAVMSCCSNEKEVVSVGLGLRNSAKNYATVRVYKSNRKQPCTLQHQHLPFGTIVKDIHFIKFSKYCVTLCQYQNSIYVSVYRTKTETLITYNDSRDPYFQLLGAISSADTFVAIGAQVLKIWKINLEEKQLDDTEILIEGQQLISAAQVKNHFCTLSQSGMLYYYKKGKLSDQLDIHKEFQEQPCLISSYSQGVIVSFEGVPLIAVYDVFKGQLSYRRQYRLNIANFSKMAYLHVGPDDSYIAVTAQHRLRQKLFDEVDSIDNYYYEMYLFNFGIVDIINAALRDPFEALFPMGVHKQRILNVDMSPCKSIIATLSEDKSLKLWEFSYTRGEFKCLYSMQLHESPLCMSLHPMSFQCAIGYREGLKFYFVLQDDLKQVYYENLKQCTVLRYGVGGNVLAVGAQSQILLYDPFTYTVLQSITGHSGLIQSLEWRDALLISTCSLGVVLCYNQQRVLDHSFKIHKAYCHTYDPDYDLLIGSYVDQKVRIFNEKGLNMYQEIDIYPLSFMVMVIFKQLDILVVGTACGKIRIYLWPFTVTNDDTQFLEMQLHQGAITQIRISADLTYLITGSDDGTMQVCKMKEFWDGKEITASELISKEMDKTNFSLANLYNFNHLAFVSQNSQEIKRDQNKELDFRISNLKSDIDDQKQEIILKYNRYIKELEGKNAMQIADQKEFLSQIMEDSDARHKLLDSQLQILRKDHLMQSHNYRENTESGLLSLYKKSDELQAQRKQLISNNEEQLSRIQIDYRQILNSAGRDFDDKYQDLRNRFNESNGALKLDELKFKEVFQQTENEFQILITQARDKQLVKLQSLQDTSEQIRSQNTKLAKECERFTLRKADLDSLIRETKQQIDHLEAERQNFKQANRDMKNQLKDKEKMIFHKEKEIKNFRNKNGHLQNFKNVNSYQLSSLQEQRSPLLDHLNELDSSVKVMYQELTDEAEAEKNLLKLVEETGDQINQSKQKYHHKNDQLFLSRSQIAQINHEILAAIAKPELDMFKQNLQAIHKEFFIDQKDRINLGQTEDALMMEIERNSQQAIREELFRQRDFLSKKLNTVTLVNKQNDDDKDNLIIKVQNENTQLIRNCNELREQRASLMSHLGNMDKALLILNKEIGALNDGEIASSQDDVQEMDMSLKPKPILKKKQSAPKLTTFQRYHQQKDEQKHIRSQQLQKGPIKQTELNSLLAEIKTFNKSDYDLRDQVQQFMRNDESSILPHILKYPGNQSQEDTQVALALESSIATMAQNTSIEAGKLLLPPIKQNQ